MNYYNPSYYGTSQQYMSQQLNGKIVDSEEMARATEVPIGGYGIFPKADFSEIYFKSWNGNGTISIIKFVPAAPPAPEENPMDKLNARMDILEQKMAELNKVDYKEVF